MDKIYITFTVCLYYFTNFSFPIYFSTAENQHKNRILWQLAKIRLDWISQSNGSIGLPLGFVNHTSASLYRIAPCLSGPSLKKDDYYYYDHYYFQIIIIIIIIVVVVVNVVVVVIIIIIISLNLTVNN